MQKIISSASCTKAMAKMEIKLEESWETNTVSTELYAMLPT